MADQVTHREVRATGFITEISEIARKRALRMKTGMAAVALYRKPQGHLYEVFNWTMRGEQNHRERAMTRFVEEKNPLAHVMAEKREGELRVRENHPLQRNLKTLEPRHWEKIAGFFGVNRIRQGKRILFVRE